MIGRDEQLADLRTMAAAAAARRPAVVVVFGEAGIGKTRLVDELAAGLQRDRVIVARGNCSAAAASGLALAPVIEVLQHLRSALGPSFGRLTGGGEAAIGALLPVLDGHDRDAVSDAVPSQAQLFDAVARLLRDVARARRVLVVIEDVHWADETSRDLLEFVARSLRDEQLMLVLTARTDDPAFESCRSFVAELGCLRHGARLELVRLSPAEVAEQVAALRGGVATDPNLARIVDITGGVPLFVEEVVDADLADVGRFADLLLGHRLSRLSPAARAVVESAAGAVLAPSPEALARAAPVEPDEFDSAFAEAVTAGVLVRHDHTVQFRHALLREATLARALPNAEREVHRRWSAVLGDHPQGLNATVAAAHHRRLCGDLGGALEAYVEAARLARRISAYAEETRMLIEAAALWPSVPDADVRTGTNLTDVYGDAAWAVHLSEADVEESKRLVDAAIAALPPDASPHRRAMLRLLWHRTRWSGDDHLTTAEVLDCVAEVRMEPASDEAMLACLEATDALLQGGDVVGANAFAGRGVAVAESLDRPELTARALSCRAMTEVRLGDGPAGRRTAERAVALAEASGDLFVLAEALAVLELVRWISGDDVLGSDARLLEILGGDRPGPLPGRWGIAQANRAEALIDAGEWDEARETLDAVLAEQMPDWVFWAAKRLEEHLSVLRGDRPMRTDDMPPAPRRDSLDDTYLDDLLASHFTYADIAHRWGDLASARGQTMSVLGDDRIVSNPGFLFQLLWVAARIEADTASAGHDPAPADGDWVTERIRHLVALTPPGNARDRAFVSHALADLERREGTATPALWDGVVADWRQVRRPFALATALVRAAAAYVGDGRSEEARDLLREAGEIAERLGARPLCDEVGAVARQAHLRLAVGGAGTSAGLGLTPRELDVLRLVAEGASNSSIAASLFISPKTVSVHVSNILAKLEVSNRGAAAAVAHRAGLVPSPLLK